MKRQEVNGGGRQLSIIALFLHFPLHTLHSLFQLRGVSVCGILFPFNFLYIYSTVRIHGEFGCHFTALHGIDGIQWNCDQNKADTEGNQQQGIAFQMRQHVIDTQICGNTQIFLFEQIQGRRFRKALSAVSAPNGGYRGNAAQLSCTVHTEQHDQKDDQQGTENIYKEVNTAVLHNHIHTDSRHHDTTDRYADQQTEESSAADKKCIFHKIQAPYCLIPQADRLHDADFAILLFHCEQQGKAKNQQSNQNHADAYKN